MPPGHHGPAAAVAQHGPGPAQRLGDQRPLAFGALAPQHGRVELDELQVPQHGPGPRRDGDPVAGRADGIGRRRERLAESARGDDRRRGAKISPAPLSSPTGSSLLARSPVPRCRRPRPIQVERDRPVDDLDRAGEQRGSTSARWTSAPEASSPECTIRRRLWPPSSRRSRCSSRAPWETSHSIAAGDPAASAATAAASQRPGARRSRVPRVRLGLSPGPIAAARPPWASGDAPPARSLVTIRTRSPRGRRRQRRGDPGGAGPDDHDVGLPPPG